MLTGKFKKKTKLKSIQKNKQNLVCLRILPLEKKFERVGMGFPTLCVDTGCASVSAVLCTGERFKPSGVPSGEGAFSRFSNSLVCAG